MEIGSAIREIRKSKGIKQNYLAKSCGMSVNAMSQIEKNKSFPHKKSIDKICKALGIPVACLLFFSIESSDMPKEKRIVFEALSDAIKSVLLT